MRCEDTEERGLEAMIKQLKMRCMIALHFISSTAVMTWVWFWFYAPQVSVAEHRAECISEAIIYLMITVFLYHVYNVYKVGRYRVGEVFYAQTLANLLSDGVTYATACILQFRLLTPWPVLLVFVLQTVISAIWCLAANHLYFRLHKPRRTLLIYGTDSDLEKLSEINRYGNRFDVQDQMENPGSIREILPRMNGFGTVFVSGIPATLRNGIVKECIEKNIECYFIPHTGDVIISGAEHVQCFSVPIMRARRARLQPEYAFVKRMLDIIFSLTGLVVASPFMIVTAFLIKLYDKGPVFYKQVRLTKDRREFEILKFRSMRVDAEKDGKARLATEHDDRITPVGKFIRACRLDELPQLINILKGDMSIVGPRPERPEIAAQYEQEMPAFSLRLQVKAGLTGTAQVYGKYNTEPKDKLKMDLMYINNMSLAEDLKLMFATARILFMKESTEGIEKGQTTAMGDVVQMGVDNGTGIGRNARETEQLTRTGT